MGAPGSGDRWSRCAKFGGGEVASVVFWRDGADGRGGLGRLFGLHIQFFYPRGILICEPSLDTAAAAAPAVCSDLLSKLNRIDSDSFRASARSTRSRNNAWRMRSTGPARSALVGSFRRPDRFAFARACYSGAVSSSSQNSHPSFCPSVWRVHPWCPNKESCCLRASGSWLQEIRDA